MPHGRYQTSEAYQEEALKLSKTTLLVIVIGIFVVVGIGLNMVRSQQVSEQSQLNEELALAKAKLDRIQPDKLSSQQAELEEQLSQATSQFEVVRAMFSQSIGSIAVTSSLFDIAKEHDVEVTEMTSSGLASDSLEGVSCSVISLTAKVEGDVPNLVNFITKLNSHFTTGVVKSITITIPETTSGENVSADIQLAVYTPQGD